MGQAQQNRRAVLIVEDDAELREFAARLLEDGELDTIECESAEAALATMLIRGRDVAMIFSDIRLPGVMDGIDLARGVRMRWPFLPVILVQERPLYDHLVRNPRFTACIDAWWIEPVRHGEFRIDQPFLDLPNVIASPHNSAQGTGAHNISLRRAVENCRRALTGETPFHVIGLDERLM
jgi:CheY-like chemotaxis protein